MQPDYHVVPRESETYDIYLVPPGEDPETCQSWLRMRYRDGRYNLMFEEWVVEVGALPPALAVLWLCSVCLLDWTGLDGCRSRAAAAACHILQPTSCPPAWGRTPHPTPHPCCTALQGQFIISPRVTFEVPVRILGGLMALGYEIGSIMRRTSEIYADSE